MRRLLILASAMVFFDVVFFSAIAPLLPDYVAELGLSKAQAGILSASYAAGTLLFSLPAGLAGRPRRAAPHGDRRPAPARRRQRRLRLRRRVRPARRWPASPRAPPGALIWSGALTWLITDCAARAARLGDRHRAGHGGRRRPARPGAGRAGGRGRHRARLQRRCSWWRSSSPPSPRACRRPRCPSARTCARSRRRSSRRPILTGDRLRRRSPR